MNEKRIYAAVTKEFCFSGAKQGHITLTRKVVRLLRRIVNYLIGTGPYRAFPFAKLIEFEQSKGLLLARPESKKIISHTKGAVFSLKPGNSSSGQSILITEPERSLFSMLDASIIGLKGVVYDPKSRYAVTETLEDWYEPGFYHTAFSMALSEPEYLPGTTLSLSSLGSANFYHFLLEALPKLLLARPYLKGINRILIDKANHKTHKAWIRAAGFDGEIREINASDHLKCEALIFSSRLVDHAIPNPWVVNELSNTFSTDEPSKGKKRRIWAKRGENSSRKIGWEEEFFSTLAGLEAVLFDELSPEETVKICSEAELFIGLHGAAFANTVFCPPATKVIEVQIQGHFPYYEHLAQLCKLNYDCYRISDGDFSGVLEQLKSQPIFRE